MKLSFSTVGCPQWRWSDIVAAASDLGYDGIELRGLGEELYMPHVDRFRPERVADTRDGLEKRGLAITCLASDVPLHSRDGDPVAAMKDYLALAHALGAPYIRALGDSWGEPGAQVDEALVLARLRELAPEAERQGVALLVETNGVWSDTKKLRRLIDEAGSPAVAVLWDINHPVRNFGETVATTWDNIGGLVRHVHLKDSVSQNGKTVYKMLGYGDLPIGEALQKLKQSGFEGALSLEWVKRWNSELEESDVVFPHYIYQIRKMWQNA